MRTRVLTGITTSGTPHLGNYVGAIRSSIKASQRDDVDAFYFMADYHALIKCDDPARLARSRLEIAATWLAAGLDPERVTFYRQSDVPEILELCWFLTCVTGKGLMNRAHAYKASVDQNLARGVDPDDGITMGLFSYPVLMAADILMFNAHKVPVGRDQIQHLEMARDIAQRFNHLYGQGRDFFVLPEVVIEEDVATLPGLDGRKMSKSYNNTIPLFEGGAKATRSALARLVTDSLPPGQAKDAEGSHLYTLYRAFASSEEAAGLRRQLQDGMGWGDAKSEVADRIERDLAPMRDRYAALMARPDRIEAILRAGAHKARGIAQPFLAELRAAVGLRSQGEAAAKTVQEGKDGKTAKTAQRPGGKPARFVSFRDELGQFRFRFLASDGEELLRSEPHADPKAAGALIGSLQAAPDRIELIGDGLFYRVLVDQTVVGYGPPAESESERDGKMNRLRAALAALSEAAANS